MKIVTMYGLLAAMTPIPQQHHDFAAAMQKAQYDYCGGAYRACLNSCDRYYPGKPNARAWCKVECRAQYNDCREGIRG